MDFTAPHVSFVIISYAVSFAVLLGLVGWVLVRGARLKRRLDRLETGQTARRKPATASNSPTEQQL